MPAKSTIELYRPVGQSELEAIRAADWRAFPPRESTQQMFCPLLSEEDAVRIARDWNTRDPRCGCVGYVVRFLVKAAYLKRFEVNVFGTAATREHWVPAKDLADFNSHIEGPIELIAKFHPPSSTD